MLITQIILLALGLALVVKGGELFVDSSVRIAQSLRVPRPVIGGTLVSLATTSPEFTVSATASFLRDPGIALGNAVGSVIANIALVIGVLAALTRVQVDVRGFRGHSLWMILSAALVILLSSSRQLPALSAAALVAVAAAYLFYNYYVASLAREKNLAQGKEQPETTPLTKSILVFLLGAGLVLIGSRLLVTSGISLAQALGIPSVIVGLTVVAVGTSLPELVTAVTSARRGVPDLSVGNIVGANVLDLTLVVGTSGLIHPLTLSPFTRDYSYSWMIGIILVMMLFFWKRGSAGRREGIVLLALYAVYLAGLLIFSP
jgi:cation:H+ antiporter